MIFGCTTGGRTCTVQAMDATIGASAGHCATGTTASSDILDARRPMLLPSGRFEGRGAPVTLVVAIPNIPN